MALNIDSERTWVMERLGAAGLMPVPVAQRLEELRPFPPPHEPGMEKQVVRRLVLDPGHVERMAFSAVVRRVPHDTYRHLLVGTVRPRAGDIVLARVTRVGHHGKLEHPSGRRRPLEPGMEIILACGNRYATDQFEAFVPASLGPAHLVAAGGLAGIVMHRARGVQRPTDIEIVGVFADENGIALNLAAFSLPPAEGIHSRPPVVAVFGTSMNSGKTTTSRFLTRGLVRAGYRVGYGKVTGTGSGGDRWAIRDEGASLVLDFTDAGLASTYKTPIPIIERALARLVGHLSLAGCERIVLEFADGLFQEEAAALLQSQVVRGIVHRTIFAANDSLGAVAGSNMLAENGFTVVGIAGLVTASPLPLRETAAASRFPVWAADELSHPLIAAAIAGPTWPGLEPKAARDALPD